VLLFKFLSTYHAFSRLLDQWGHLLHHIALTLPNLAGLAGAGLACGYAAIQIGRALLARRWPTVEGEIADARVVRFGDGQRSNSVDSLVTYRYHVAGQSYSSNRVRFGELTPNSMVPARDSYPNTAAALAARYPRGKPVRVYYNPRRPGESVLYPTPTLRVWVILAAGLYLAYAGIHGGMWPLTLLS
jgi:Protein of unknown function (DUF3592)